jgi:4-hydroxy-tetrahydrodipicolinate reductase
MGREVLAATRDRDDCEVVFAVNRSPESEAVEGVEVESAVEFAPLLAEREPTVVVDFTGPESTREYAAACADAGVALVTGTTGFDADETLREASESVPVLHSPNFARGVQVLLNVVGEAVRTLPGYDVELVETHHSGKRDAPSGTANRLLEAIESNGDVSGRAYGRAGEAPREAGEVGVHAIRAGNVTGEHEVIVAGDHEEVRLTHRAEDRGVFAAGALDAATWIAERSPGWYDFAEVIEA